MTALNTPAVSRVMADEARLREFVARCDRVFTRTAAPLTIGAKGWALKVEYAKSSRSPADRSASAVRAYGTRPRRVRESASCHGGRATLGRGGAFALEDERVGQLQVSARLRLPAVFERVPAVARPQ